MNRQFDRFFFGIFLSAVKESYIQVLLAGVLFNNMPVDLENNLKSKGFEYLHSKGMVWLSLIMTLGVYPFFSLLVFLLGRSTLMHRIPRVRFGVIYEDIDLYKRNYRIYPLIYVLRRIMQVGLLSVDDLEGIQVQILMYTGSFVMVYVGVVRPFKQRTVNNQNLFNEFIILILTTIMVIFTNFCGVPET